LETPKWTTTSYTGNPFAPGWGSNLQPTDSDDMMNSTRQMRLTRLTGFAHGAVIVAAVLTAAPAVAQQTPPPATPATTQPADDPLVRVGLPPVTVTAQKEPADLRTLPLSVTAVSKEMLDALGVRVVSDAAIVAPNVSFTEFTARKLSNARFRGIGSSPNNPAITTFIDGVPQLNANSSSVELLDVQQIEFVRGPQSTLFGRNAIGGVINVSSVKPAFTEKWTGTAQVPFGNYSAFDLRANASGALIPDTLAAGVALAYGARDGYTINTVTGDDLDSRGTFAFKGQLLWVPAKDWTARVIVSGERDEDGDYALNDLAALRARDHESARDFEGHTDRNVFGTTILTERKGSRFNLSTTTGFVRWTSEDSTDLDYSALPLITRLNNEEDFQFTQEVRLASVEPRKLTDKAMLRWQAGAFLFTQSYQQDAVNTIAPFVFSTQVSTSVNLYSPVADLEDFGFGVFGQGTATINEKIDVTAGLRVDYEKKDADLKTFYDPALGAPAVLVADDSFSHVSPQVSVAYRLNPTRSVYGTVTGGYKAGGFNPASPTGSEVYGEEKSWNFEAGYKSVYLNDRLWVSAALFYIDWNDLQLNVPYVQAAQQFFIANVGGASSKGFEVEATARPMPGLDVFGGLGYTNARFSDGSTANGLDVSENEIPNTPNVTFNLGAQYGRTLNFGTVYGRADVVVYGPFKYDELNLEGQDAYALTNLRLGARRNLFFAEAWIKNVFDTKYIPIAFAYGNLAPSGFIGESGAPRTFGLSVGVKF
jgi:iron complex outermembrane recepter protein